MDLPSTGTLKTRLSNEWTLAVLNTPTIAETAGVTVSQGGVAKGTLKTTLSGNATSVVIETASGVTIVANADVTIGTTLLVHANIDTATNNGATTTPLKISCFYRTYSGMRILNIIIKIIFRIRSSNFKVKIQMLVCLFGQIVES